MHKYFQSIYHWLATSLCPSSSFIEQIVTDRNKIITKMNKLLTMELLIENVKN